MAERFFSLRRCQRALSVFRGWRENTALRERTAASVVFAGILLFALVSLNYLVSGGPDWNPGASPAQASPSIERAAANSVGGFEPEAPPVLPAPALDPVEFFDTPGPVGDLLGEPGRGESLAADENFDVAEFNRAVDQLAAQNAGIAYPSAPPAAPEKPKPQDNIF